MMPYRRVMDHGFAVANAQSWPAASTNFQVRRTLGGTCSRFISPGVCGLGDLPAMLIIGVATSELIFAKPVFPLELHRPDLSQKCTEAEQGSDYQSGTQLSSRASRENQHTTYNGRQNS